MKSLFLFLITLYQRVSYMVKSTFGMQGSCRFTPTCSQYMYRAIEEHGIIKGSFLGIVRILRCNPFSKGGYDPVPKQP